MDFNKIPPEQFYKDIKKNIEIRYSKELLNFIDIIHKTKNDNSLSVEDMEIDGFALFNVGISLDDYELPADFKDYISQLLDLLLKNKVYIK